MKSDVINGLNKGGLYRIKCHKNGKIYIGNSIRVKMRMYNHYMGILNQLHPHKKINVDAKKYSIEDFSFEVIMYINNYNLRAKKEIALIKRIPPHKRYNAQIKIKKNKESGLE